MMQRKRKQEKKEGGEGMKKRERKKERRKKGGEERRKEGKDKERNRGGRTGMALNPASRQHQGTSPTLLFQNMPELSKLKKWVTICMQFACNLHAVC